MVSKVCNRFLGASITTEPKVLSVIICHQLIIIYLMLTEDHVTKVSKKRKERMEVKKNSLQILTPKIYLCHSFHLRC